VFIQVIQGRCNDVDRIHSQMDRWHETLEDGATGFLGATYGLTDDGEFIGVVRFDSRESAMANSDRPEQGAWWAETASCFDGEPTFHDCDDVRMMLDGGSDSAGFVQVIQGRISDPEKVAMMMDQPMDMLHRERPEIIGGTMAVDADGFFTQTMAFTTEDAAREGEHKEMPAEMAETMAGMEMAMADVSYHDLRHPWFTSGRS
jgi:hypothetical protein